MSESVATDEIKIHPLVEWFVDLNPVCDWVATGLITVVLVAGASYLDLWTSELAKLAGPTVYGSVASMSASALGFLIAALAIVLGYLRSRELRFLRRKKVFKQLISTYTAAIQAFCLLIVVALVGCVSFLSPIMACMLGASAVLALLKILRCSLMIGILAEYILKRIDEDLKRADHRREARNLARAKAALEEEMAKADEAREKAQASKQEFPAQPPESPST